MSRKKEVMHPNEVKVMSYNPNGRTRRMSVLPQSEVANGTLVEENPNLLWRRPLDNFPLAFHPLIERLSYAHSLCDVKYIVFGERTDLGLIDLGTGDGQLPLAIARQKRTLGIQEIVGLDRNLAELRQNRKALEENNIPIIHADINQYPGTDKLFDIVTILSPIGQTNQMFRQFIKPAINLATRITRRPGVVLIRPTPSPSCREPDFDSVLKKHVSKNTPMLIYQPLEGLPDTFWSKNDMYPTYLLVLPRELSPKRSRNVPHTPL